MPFEFPENWGEPIMPRIITSLLLILAAPVLALEEPPAIGNLVPVPEQPDLPPPIESGENMEPDITIIRKGQDIIEEYRINHRLYMVKITPRVGPPYYLVDTDGDGNMDVRRRDIEDQMQVPQWVLFRW
jgi:hypothetical protein